MKMHGVVYYERYCRKCRNRVKIQVHDYGLLDFETLDEKIGHTNFELRPLECPKCGQEELPENLAMYNKIGNHSELMFRKTLGSEELPVIGEGGEYGVTRSTEEQAEYDRGLEKIQDVWEERKEEFWDGYCRWAIEDWRKAVSELEVSEMTRGCQEVGLPLLPGSASVAAWRKTVRGIEEGKRQQFWEIANTEMIEKDILWVFPDHWDMDRFIRRYGRERMRYVILHIPLPEELEKWRTEAISKLVKKKTGDTGVLFERIGQLGQELDRQRKRSQQLSLQLREERQHKADLEEKLSILRRELEESREKRQLSFRDADDVRKIRSLKGLVRELRREVERLNDLIPKSEEEEEPILKEKEEKTQQKEQEPDLSHLQGKTVAVFGRLGDVKEIEGIRILYHDGDRVNLDMARVAREADILIVLTRWVSHGVMWRLKEYSAEQGKEIRFVRETGIKRILEQI